MTTSPFSGLPVINATKDGPFIVKGLDHFRDLSGKELPIKPVISLCRCGTSGNKPYCDGSHIPTGFNDEKSRHRVKEQLLDYLGKELAINDNRGICSHDGSCTRGTPAVFNLYRTPWIDPNAASKQEIITTIEKCPSGALSYTLDGKRYQEWGQTPAIVVDLNGPFQVQGGITFKDDIGSKPECSEHYTLCRCGGSHNKPFCDGQHLKNGGRS